MPRNDYADEQYDEALTAATRPFYAKFVADLAAEGESLQTAAEEALYWDMAEDYAEAELAKRMHDAADEEANDQHHVMIFG